VHKTLPLVLLTGHGHASDQRINRQENTYLIETPAFFTKFGKIEFEVDESRNLTFTSLGYVDGNRKALKDLVAPLRPGNFMTDKGRAALNFAEAKFKELKLGKVVGCSPKTYLADMKASTDVNVYNLFITKMLPSQLFTKNSFTNPFSMVSGDFIRENIYQGEITLDDIYTTVPFEESYQVMMGVSGSDLKSLMKQLVSGQTKFMFTEDQSTISNSKTYDFVSDDYASKGVQAASDKLFGAGKYSTVNVPNNLSGRQVLQGYIEQSMACAVQ